MHANTSVAPEQACLVAGMPWTDVPKDLFIPPDALEVLLDSFSGPLDLLLYLIRRQNLDIMDIPIVLVTEQYMQYIGLMNETRMELAADYLVMAAVLAEIKSRLLLPVIHEADDEEIDPRLELVRRLQAYEQFKQAAYLLDELPRLERDVFPVLVHMDPVVVPKTFPEVDLSSLFNAISALCVRETHFASHSIVFEAEVLSVRERMVDILERLQHTLRLEFTQLFSKQEGRMGVVVSFLAILELAKQSLLVVTQTSAYASIHIQGVHDG